jgi:hypothetical protein
MIALGERDLASDHAKGRVASASLDPRSAALGEGSGVSRHAAFVVECAAQDQLDLSVEAAQLLGGPSCEGIVDRGVDAQEERLAVMAHV